MIFAVPLFAMSFFCAVIGSLIALRLAPRIGLLDLPDGFRKNHPKPIPLIGGPVISLSCFGTLGLFLIYHQLASLQLSLFRRDLVALSIAGFIVASLGVFDDLRGVRPRVKLAIQVLAALILVAFGFRLDVLPNPFGEPIQLGLLTVPVTVLWLLACTNAMNLVDGMDGLASSIAFIAVAAIFVLAALSGNTYMVLICAAVMGATLGFLLFNLPPAKAFLGDSGSMFLGFAYGAVAFRGLSAFDPGFSVLVPSIIFAVPIVDTALAIARRWVRGRPIFSADKDHIHHRLLAMGFSGPQVLRLIVAACCVLAALGTAIATVKASLAALLFAFVVVSGIAAIRFVWCINISHLLCEVSPGRVFNRLKENIGVREKEIDCWARYHVARAKLSNAKSSEDIFRAVEPVLESLDVEEAELELADPFPNGASKLCWKNGKSGHCSSQSEPSGSRLQISLSSNGTCMGYLRVSLGVKTTSIPCWFQILKEIGVCAGQRLEQILQGKGDQRE